MKSIMVLGLLIFSAVYFLFGFATTLSQFVILFGLYSFYAAATEGISKAWITNLSSKKHTATAIGFYNSFQSVATLLASSIAGLIWYKVNPSALFIISGLGAFIVSIYLVGTSRVKTINNL